MITRTVLGQVTLACSIATCRARWLETALVTAWTIRRVTIGALVKLTLGCVATFGVALGLILGATIAILALLE